MPRCKVCKQKFTPFRMGQKTCAETDCLVTWGRHMVEVRAVEAMRERERKIRERKLALKTRVEWARDAQAAVNAFIRERDNGQPCISCGKLTGCKMNAGHYISRGAHPELRFHEDNLSAQCEKCNSWLSGNQVAYRKGLIEKIGLERVEWLEGPHEPKKYTIDELKGIRDLYRRKLKELKNG